MDRTLVIIRHTFREAIVQPIYTLLLGLGAAILIVFSMLPFFTFGEDTMMFKGVGLDIILLFLLIATLFATSKSIYEEIEDRTMLTLMSKPIRRWQVLIGKYVGIILAALMGIAILGGILILCTWWRIPSDYSLQVNALDQQTVHQLFSYRSSHIAGILASLVLMWLQISVLAAIGVALSTRVSLVVNLPVVILLYIAGNLTRFLFPMNVAGAPLYDRSAFVKWTASIVSTLLPYLEAFDLRPATVYRPIGLSWTDFAKDPNAVAPHAIGLYIGVAVLYALCYTLFALSAGMWLFQTRELGGAEG